MAERAAAQEEARRAQAEAEALRLQLEALGIAPRARQPTPGRKSSLMSQAVGGEATAAMADDSAAGAAVVAPVLGAPLRKEDSAGTLWHGGGGRGGSRSALHCVPPPRQGLAGSRSSLFKQASALAVGVPSEREARRSSSVCVCVLRPLCVKPQNDSSLSLLVAQRSLLHLPLLLHPCLQQPTPETRAQASPRLSLSLLET